MTTATIKTSKPHQVSLFQPGKQDASALIPAANIDETEGEYYITVAIPGFERKDISIQVDQNVLLISAQKENRSPDHVRDHCEFDYSHWVRAFTLPEDADVIMMSAFYKNGELLIRIPRQEGVEKESATITVYVY